MEFLIAVIPVFGIQQCSFLRRIHGVSIQIQLLLVQTPLTNFQALFFILQLILRLFEFGDRRRLGDFMVAFGLIVFTLQRSLGLNMFILLVGFEFLDINLLLGLSAFENLLDFTEAAIISETTFDQLARACHFAAGLGDLSRRL